ncbi:MAG: hypothetical protein Q8M78_03980, partial [Burkholderiaceae bacterium]|nr:hypothetical protein [Burkholderiaceae bacterium]
MVATAVVVAMVAEVRRVARPLARRAVQAGLLLAALAGAPLAALAQGQAAPATGKPGAEPLRIGL